MEFKGKISDLTRDYKSGNARLTIESDENILREAETLQDMDLSIKIVRHRKKRSKDANAYFWVLADKLAEKLRTDKIKIYREYIKDIAGNNYFLCLKTEAVPSFCKDWESHGLGWVTETCESRLEGCTDVFAYYGSSQYDSAQMSRLIELVVRDCEENDISTLTPRERAVLMSDWAKHIEEKASREKHNEQINNAN